MITIHTAHSELTGKPEHCSICPELRSEIDGKLIVDGTPDCDLLAMHEFAFDNEFGMVPASLITDRHGNVKQGGRVVLQASDKFCKKIARRQRTIVKSNEERDTKAATVERIRSNEHKWQTKPNDAEVQDIIFNETGFIIGLMRLMSKIENG